MTNFLLELGTEEIPAGYIQPAIEQGAVFLKGFLKEKQLSFDDFGICHTPRRMVFFISGLPQSQQDILKEIGGPPVTVAYDKDNNPTKAFYGFVKRNNIDEKQVQIKESPKGKIIFAEVNVKGEKTEGLLVEAIGGLVRMMPFPKSMWWDNKELSFARPLRYIVAVFGSQSINAVINGVPCANKSKGHPFSDYKEIEVTAADFDNYKNLLRQAYVVVDEKERRNIIEQEINSIAQKNSALSKEPSLLDEVVNLVEYPNVIECGFDDAFLKLPPAVIESAMKQHQRYFPMKDKSGRLISRFIVVSNNPDGSSKQEIGDGNERVLRARLSDALFFWESDRKFPLTEYAKRLDSIAFLGKMGTLADKSVRLKELALFIAQGWCESEKTIIEKAAGLCKADLLTGMVGEFPDLQGVMGYEYLKEKEAGVAAAIKEHYQPRFAGDSLPESSAGVCLSLAEKFDNLAGCFIGGLKPSGSQDPYGLRRQAGAVVDIIRDKKLITVSLKQTIRFAIDSLQKYLTGSALEVEKEIFGFIGNRLMQDYLAEGYNVDLINAVMASDVDYILKINLKMEALNRLSKETEIWNELVEVVERTYNIGKNTEITGEVDESLLKEQEEVGLYDCYKKNKDEILGLINKQDYESASRLYAGVFAKPAHIFFEKVFVNVEDARLRNNRILLNQKVNRLYSEGIADLSKIPRHS